jgi:hypothetical protein
MSNPEVMFPIKMINIGLFSVGSRGEFYLNITSYVSCILRHFVLFCAPLTVFQSGKKYNSVRQKLSNCLIECHTKVLNVSPSLVFVIFFQSLWYVCIESKIFFTENASK